MFISLKSKVKMLFLWPFLMLIFTVNANLNRKLPVLKYIDHEVDLTVFYSQLFMSALSRHSLNYREVTVFAPTDGAFRKFSGKLGQNLTTYHIAYNAYLLRELNDTYLESIQRGLPPLWIRKYNGDTYVNNALIIKSRSNYQANHRTDVLGKPQVLHIIDEVLDPCVYDVPESSWSAYDFMTKSKAYRFKNFLSKVFQHKLAELYQGEGAHTFFIPIDEGMDDYRTRMTDQYIIKAHIIPNKVLFTKPVSTNAIFDSLADVDYIYILLSFVKENVKYFVKSNTIQGDANHRKGEIKVEILHANIPVKNGVIHIISKPLGVFDKVLSKFPYLPVIDKLAMDPYLNVSYTLGRVSGFNAYLKQPKKFTFFVPRDYGWKKIKYQYDYDRLIRLGYMNEINKIMGRHLIVGDIPYSMETLYNASLSGCLYLKTSTGRSCMTVLDKNNDKNFIIKWNDIYIDVYKSNYECTDGLIHIIDRPFVTNEDIKNMPEESVSFFQLWSALHKLLSAT